MFNLFSFTKHAWSNLQYLATACSPCVLILQNSYYY